MVCAAIVALEVGRRLEEEGEQVAFVALLDARDIFLPPMNQFRRVVVRSWRFAQRIVFFGSEVRSLWQKATNWNAGVRKTAHRFQELAADPNGILVPALRHYQPKPWSGRTIHLWAAERPKGAFRDPEFTGGTSRRPDLDFTRYPATMTQCCGNRTRTQLRKYLARSSPKQTPRHKKCRPIIAS